MSVGLGVMVRDDARRLERCIRSVRDAVDEVYVLDTGSVDASVRVAKEFGAVVHEIEWPGSFSAGLNTLLDMVETEWVLRLDSDEWFEPSLMDELRSASRDEDVYGYRLVRRDLLPQGRFEEIGLLRLWRAHPNLRYQGVVHENIPVDEFAIAWPGKHESLLPLTFLHDGYAGGEQLLKIRRNVELLEKEVASNPQSLYHRALLAKGYRDLGDARWVGLMEQIAGEALSSDTSGSRMLIVIFSDLLAQMTSAQLASTLGQAILAKGAKWFGDSPVMIKAIADANLRLGNREQTLEALQRLANMAFTGKYDRTLPTSDEMLGKPMWRRLDRLADQLGRRDVCAKCEPFL